MNQGSCIRIFTLFMIAMTISESVVFGEMAGQGLPTGAESFEKDIGEVSVRRKCWRISAGALYREFDSISFDSGMNSSLTALSQGIAAKGAAIGSEFSDREYDDGYVRMDPGTGVNGDTWYWGYADSDQVSGDSIWFHSDLGIDLSTGVDVSISSGNWNKGNLSAPTYFVEAERIFRHRETMDFGVVVNVSMSSIDASDSHSTFHAEQHVTQYYVSESDRYNLDGMIPPGAPYSGTYGGPGPLLEENPDEHIETRIPLRSGTTTQNLIHEELIVDLWTLGVGLSATKEARGYTFSFEAGPTINVIATEASHDEWLISNRNGTASPVAEWHDSSSETELMFGMFGQFVFNLFDLSDSVQVGLVGRYDWVETITGAVGPSNYEVDLKGVSGGITLGFVY
jgi:hypothetical protein